MIGFMSDDEQQAILSEDYDSEAYQTANEHYMQLHCAGPFDEATPECVKREKKTGLISKRNVDVYFLKIYTFAQENVYTNP